MLLPEAEQSSAPVRGGLGVQMPSQRTRFQPQAFGRLRLLETARHEPEHSMKKFTILAVAIAFVATLSVSAQEDAKPKKKREIPADVLKKYDKNGDGKLDETERAEMRKDRPGKQKKDAAPDAK
jgi:hypothetical protein